MSIFKMETISPNGLGLQVAEILCASHVNCQRSQPMYAFIRTTYCSGSDVCSSIWGLKKIYKPR